MIRELPYDLVVIDEEEAKYGTAKSYLAIRIKGDEFNAQSIANNLMSKLGTIGVDTSYTKIKEDHFLIIVKVDPSSQDGAWDE